MFTGLGTNKPTNKLQKSKGTPTLVDENTKYALPLAEKFEVSKEVDL